MTVPRFFLPQRHVLSLLLLGATAALASVFPRPVSALGRILAVPSSWSSERHSRIPLLSLRLRGGAPKSSSASSSSSSKRSKEPHSSSAHSTALPDRKRSGEKRSEGKRADSSREKSGRTVRAKSSSGSSKSGVERRVKREEVGAAPPEDADLGDADGGADGGAGGGDEGRGYYADSESVESHGEPVRPRLSTTHGG
jgi:hypothetical protein